MLAGLLATSAFAELNIGAGWNTGVWTPFLLERAENDKGEQETTISMKVGTPWGGAVRTGISFAGSGENIGFVFDIKAGDDNSGVAINDQTFVWAKPWDWLEIRAGQWFCDALKSAQSYGIRNSNRIGLGNTETTTFARMYGGFYDDPMKGALLAITPIEGLFIGAGFEIANGGTKEAIDVFKGSQYAAGYTIDGLLAIKAQYIGGKTAGIFGSGGVDSDLKGTINAAVDLLMLEGMKISVGAFIPLEKDTNISFAGTFDGGFDALSINAYVGAEIAMGDGAYKKAKVENGYNVGIEAGVGVGYDLGNGVGLSGDLRYRIDLPEADGVDPQNEVTVGLFVSKGMSNGSLSIGVEGDFGFGQASSIGIAVPLAIVCGF